MTMANNDGQWPLPQEPLPNGQSHRQFAMANGRWPSPLAMATDHRQSPWSPAMVASHGHWQWSMTIVSDDGPCPEAMAYKMGMVKARLINSRGAILAGEDDEEAA